MIGTRLFLMLNMVALKSRGQPNAVKRLGMWNLPDKDGNPFYNCRGFTFNGCSYSDR